MRIRTAAAIFGAVTLIAGCSRPAQTRHGTTRRHGHDAVGGTREPRRGTGAVGGDAGAGQRRSPRPIPVPATDGKVHLAYELELTNALEQEVTLTSVTVHAGDVTLLTLAGDQLGYWTRVLGTPTPTTKSGPPRPRSSGSTSPLDDGRAPSPHDLMHAVGFSRPEADAAAVPRDHDRERRAGHRADPQAGRHRAAAGRPELVGRQRLLRHDARTGWRSTRSTGSCGPPNGSRSTTCNCSPTAGCSPATRPSWRATPTSAPTSTRSPTAPWWRCSTVCPSRFPARARPGCRSTSTRGNHIVQDLGDGNYALYAHLKTGSRQGQARRPAHHRAGDRLARQHRQLRCAAPAFPRDEHARSAALRRTAVRVHRRSGSTPGSPSTDELDGAAATGKPAPHAARIRRPRRNRRHATGIST